jgi:hypothetical protein
MQQSIPPLNLLWRLNLARQKQPGLERLMHPPKRKHSFSRVDPLQRLDRVDERRTSGDIRRDGLSMKYLCREDTGWVCDGE